MKFKNLSCEELKKEFKQILNEYSDNKLFNTLKSYIIDNKGDNKNDRL